ncbi:MAG: hypothetical protein IPJ79_00260 [Bacteroidetes bacterium]|nr:hypothetical protein [Bacteroidota bacterium]
MTEKNILKESRLVYLTCFLFLICYCLIGFYNRLSHDDLAYLQGVNTDGIVNATIKNYNSWNTRWAGVLMANTVFSFVTIDSNLLWFHVLSLVFLFLSASFFLQKVLIKFSISTTALQIHLLAIYFCIVFFACTFSIGDVWFWINASCMYLWNVCFLLLGVSFALNPKLNLLNGLMIWVCGIYVGGSSEPFALISLFLLATMSGIFFSLKNQKTVAFGFMLLAVAILLGFLISCMGKGMELRSSALPDPGFLQKQFIFLKSMVKFFVFYFPIRVAIAFILSIPFYLFGRSLSDSFKIQLSLKQIAVWSAITFLIIVSASFYIIVYKMAEAGPERAWTVISFYMGITIVVLAFFAGVKKKFDWLNNNMRSLQIITISSLILFTMWQSKLLPAYAMAYDYRISYLNQLAQKKYTECVYVRPLPTSGILHSSEITADSNHFTNYHLKEFLNLPFTVVLDTTNKSAK